MYVSSSVLTRTILFTQCVLHFSKSKIKNNSQFACYKQISRESKKKETRTEDLSLIVLLVNRFQYSHKAYTKHTCLP